MGQLFQGDCHRRTPHPGPAGGHENPLVLARIDRVSAAVCDQVAVLEVIGDLAGPRLVAGAEDVAGDVLGLTDDVKLHLSPPGRSIVPIGGASPPVCLAGTRSQCTPAQSSTARPEPCRPTHPRKRTAACPPPAGGYRRHSRCAPNGAGIRGSARAVRSSGPRPPCSSPAFPPP